MIPCASNGNPPRRSLQIFLNLPHDLANLEGAALDLREGDGWHEVLRADHRRELAEVHLRHDETLQAAQDLAEVRGERADVAQLRARHAVPVHRASPGRRSERSA